jgi:hypothetical protein
MTRSNQAADAPIEAASTVVKPSVLHELKQLVVADKARIAYLVQQRDVAFRAHHQTVFGVPHDQ